MNPLFLVTTIFDIYPDGGSMSLTRTFRNGDEARSYYDAVKVQGISTQLVYSDFGTDFLLCHYVADENVGEVYNRYQRNKATREYVRRHKSNINRAYGRTVRYWTGDDAMNILNDVYNHGISHFPGYSDTDSVKH